MICIIHKASLMRGFFMHITCIIKENLSIVRLILSYGILTTGAYRCQHELNAHADTRDVRQSPTRPVGIVNNTDSSMPVMAGVTIRQERAGRNEGTVAPGKSYGRVSSSVTNTCVRTIAGRR